VAVEIRALVWDEQHEEHIAKHGVTPREVNSMVENPHIVVRNRKHRKRTAPDDRTHSRWPSPRRTASEDEFAGHMAATTAYPATQAQTCLLDQSSGSPKERS